MITAFVGKGGVGKSTVASAYAMLCARRGRTAIVSSDFMPSLRHIFTVEHENLEVIELTEKEVAEKWKQRYGHEVASVIKEFVDVDDWIIDHIAGSPGVAEEFMIAEIVELENSGRYDSIIWDTAASSSTMHLLLLEREFYGHLDRDVRIYLRLKNRFRLSNALNVLEQWKDLAGKVWSKLVESRFILVSTEDELSLLQTGEIQNDLESMGITPHGVIYNRCRQDHGHAEAIATIPELSGSPYEIAGRMVRYLAPVMDSVKRSLTEQ